MGRHIRTDTATVQAARAGDREALDQLVTEYLPLTYNVVGRAVNGHADVDDIVQETMIQVVRNLPGLRDPGRFRAWLVAIAMQQVRAWARDRKESLGRDDLDRAGELADPNADFVDVTIARLGLAGQRREVAEATRWLDSDDRQLLSLWWLEAAGALTRSELASALSVTAAHAAVRVQRLRSRLDAARTLVRALSAAQHCHELTMLTEHWDARPTSVWRKRLSRHTRHCPVCCRQGYGLVPSDRLLAGLALIPVPLALSGGRIVGGAVFEAARAAALTSWAPVGAGAGAFAPGALLAKPLASTAVYAAAIVVAAAGIQVLRTDEPGTRSPQAPIAAGPVAAQPGGRPPEHSGSFGSRGIRADPQLVRPAGRQPGPDGSGPATGSANPPRYGDTVDTAEPAPPHDRVPQVLPTRPQGRPVEVRDERGESARGARRLGPDSSRVTLRGQGYLAVSWLGARDDCAGTIVAPSWTGLRGKLFHVASGGGRRTDDPVRDHDDAGRRPDRPGRHGDQRDDARRNDDRRHDDGRQDDRRQDDDRRPGGRDSPDPPMRLRAGQLPHGAQPMWQQEYYHLDGEVVLHHNDPCPRYLLSVTATDWQRVTGDLTAPPDPPRGRVRYGWVRDRTGDDAAPVPQYATRHDSAPRRVPQHSDLRR